MSTLPPDLRTKVAARRAAWQRPALHPFTGQQPGMENPRAAWTRLCAWARVLGPLAADRPIRPDLTLSAQNYTPPRMPFKRTGGKVGKKVVDRGWKLFALVEDPTGQTPMVTDPAVLQSTDRGVVLTPKGELILVRGEWSAAVRQKDVTPTHVDYGDGLGGQSMLRLQPNLVPVPRAIELLGGLAAIEGGLVHFAALHNLDR
jgi:hypothetical protein